MKHNRIEELKNIVDDYESKRLHDVKSFLLFNESISTHSLLGRSETCPSGYLRELIQVTRDAIKLNEKVQAATNSEGEDGQDSIPQKLHILKALREQSEADNAVSSVRANSSTAKAGRNTKRGKVDISMDVDRDSVVVESPGGPSPKVVVTSGAASRLLKTGGASRSGSVPAAREPSVKVEEVDIDLKGKKQSPLQSSSELSSPPSSI